MSVCYLCLCAKARALSTRELSLCVLVASALCQHAALIFGLFGELHTLPACANQPICMCFIFLFLFVFIVLK